MPRGVSWCQHFSRAQLGCFGKLACKLHHYGRSSIFTKSHTFVNNSHLVFVVRAYVEQYSKTPWGTVLRYTNYSDFGFYILFVPEILHGILIGEVPLFLISVMGYPCACGDSCDFFVTWSFTLFLVISLHREIHHWWSEAVLQRPLFDCFLCCLWLLHSSRADHLG